MNLQPQTQISSSTLQKDSDRKGLLHQPAPSGLSAMVYKMTSFEIPLSGRAI